MSASKKDYGRRHTLKEMFRDFKAKNPDSDVTWTMYSYVIEQYNLEVVEEVLDGATFYMGHGLGSLRIKRVRRNYKRPTVDWGTTQKLKKQGINKLAYFTDKYWYRWYWDKYRAKFANKTVYRVKALEGDNNPKKKLVHRLHNDEFAHLNYHE